MILDSQHALETSGIENQRKFGVELNAIAFRVLTDRIYSDSVQAIIRELSCNAWDSHKAAGTEHVPFEVKAPSVLDPHFRIRDYGTGLSEEQVYSIYSNFFMSTKRDSNQYIGALGLGSKTPFAYTDTFTVTSYHDSQKMIFSAFLDANGTPSIAKLNHELTDEPNGLEIVVAVNSADEWKFRHKIQNTLNLFDPKPISNVEIPDMQFIEKHDDFALNGNASPNGYAATWYAVQGNISYPINKSQLKSFNQLKSANLYLFFDIGDLSFTASRESLDYDDKTIQSLNTKLETVVDAVKSKYSEIDKCNTINQAIEMFKDLNDKYAFADIFDFKGIEITKKGNLFFDHTIVRCEKQTWMSSYMSRKDTNVINNAHMNSCVLVVSDTGKNRPSLIRKLFESDSTISHCYMVDMKIITMLDSVGHEFTVHNVSSLEKRFAVQKAGTTSQAKTYYDIAQHKKIIKDEKFYYILTHGKKALLNKGDTALTDIHLKSAFDILVRAGILENIPLYFIPKSEITRREFKTRELIDFNKTIVDKQNNILKTFDFAATEQDIQSNKIRITDLREIIKQPMPIEVKSVIDKIIKISNTSQADIREIREIKNFMMSFSTMTFTSAYDALRQQFLSFFPMLKYGYSSFSPDDYKTYLTVMINHMNHINEN